jgi:tape measure domain-containing protein
MAEDVARLQVYLDARLDQFERQMKKAADTAQGTTRKIERAAQNMDSRMTAAFSRAGMNASSAMLGAMSRLGPAVAAAFSVDGLRNFSDQMTRIENSLKMAGYQGESLKSVFSQLFAIAQSQGTPIEALTTLFGRMSQSQKELGASSADMMRFTSGVATALRVQGTDANQARGALMQLSQAMASGTVRAEEFNSINEGATPILKAVANGLTEAGGSVAKLRQLVIDGQVSSEAFFNAFLAGLPELEKTAESAGMTTEQAFTKMANAMIVAASGLDRATNAFSGLIAVLDKTASLLEAIGKIAPAASDAIKGVLNNPSMMDVDIMGNPIGFNAYGDSSSSSPLPPAAATRSPSYFNEVSNGGVRRRPVKTVSLAQYPVMSAKTGITAPSVVNTGGGGGGGGAGGGNPIQQEVEWITKRTAALNLEASTIGKSSYETDKATASFEMLEAIKSSNVKITPELRAKVDELSAAYAASKQNVEQMTAAQESMKQLGQELGQSMTSFFSDMVSGGKNAEDAVMNLTKRLADMAFQAAFMGTGPMAALFGTSSSGGIFGSLFSAIPGFANGTNSAPGGLAMVGERGPELVNLPRGSQVIPNIDTRKMMQGGGSAPIVVNQTFTADSSPRELAQVAASIKADTLAAFTEMVGRGAMNARR